MKGLTARQQEIFDFICEHQEEKGFPPTIREIGEEFGLNSTGSVRDYLRALEKKGFISRNTRTSRGIEIRKKPFPRTGLRRIPLVGSIAAGEPILAEENFVDEIGVDASKYDRHSDVFALRVQGASMIEAGILDGDLVFVRKQPDAENGDIVAARVDDNEATVKYFYNEGEVIRLQPANAALEPFYFSPSDPTVTIEGKVVGIMRDY